MAKSKNSAREAAATKKAQSMFSGGGGFSIHNSLNNSFDLYADYDSEKATHARATFDATLMLFEEGGKESEDFVDVIKGECHMVQAVWNSFRKYVSEHDGCKATRRDATEEEKLLIKVKGPCYVTSITCAKKKEKKTKSTSSSEGGSVKKKRKTEDDDAEPKPLPCPPEFTNMCNDHTPSIWDLMDPISQKTWTKAPKKAREQGFLGTNGAEGCNGCYGEGVILEQFCPRCLIAICMDCESHHSRGTCNCKDFNFGEPYEAKGFRDWYQIGKF
jgi:hypothetical protein